MAAPTGYRISSSASPIGGATRFLMQRAIVYADRGRILAGEDVRDIMIALIEDAIAVGGGFLLVSRI